jgi:hypothetical protein
VSLEKRLDVKKIQVIRGRVESVFPVPVRGLRRGRCRKKPLRGGWLHRTTARSAVGAIIMNRMRSTRDTLMRRDEPRALDWDHPCTVMW